MSGSKPMWTEGLFLTPQHLQALDDYHERLVEQRVGAIAPHLWGVADLEIDGDELARGMVQISRMTAVMPDGMLLSVGSQAEIGALSTQVARSSVRGGRPIEVYVAVPDRRATGAGSADGSGGGGTRFVEGSRVVPDAYGQAEDADIACVRPNAQVMLGNDRLTGYVALKVAELVVSDGGRLGLSPRFIPPCLRVRVSETVMQKLSRVVAALAEKQKVLVGKYGDRAAAMVEFGAADVATFWYLHTVNTWLPMFMHHAESGEVHPEQLYLALSSFVGQLSTFEAQSDPLDLPKFRFDALGDSLLPLFDRILALLGSVVSSRYTQIPLDQTQPGLFVGQVDDPSLLTRR
ncbi:MAG: type VI secretion system baseplate subunit TssK, partial [Myxococcales bacterium]|nr:type VI secretion system baseplate subunit TssK [Myxococcales bacterium]